MTGVGLRGVIFDLDGTLVDTIPLCIEAFRSTFRRHGGPDLTGEETYALFGPTEEGILEKVFGPAWEAAFGSYLDEYRRLHHKYSEPFPGIRELLDDLRAEGVPLALVMAKGAHSARITLDVLRMTDCFSPIETGSQNGPIKAASIRRVLESWGLSPHLVAYVGDTSSDVVHARRAGVMPVAVAWSSHADRERLIAEKPDHYFETVGPFAEWLRVTTGIGQDHDPDR